MKFETRRLNLHAPDPAHAEEFAMQANDHRIEKIRETIAQVKGECRGAPYPEEEAEDYVARNAIEHLASAVEDILELLE